jgi:hypothetical protein
MGPPKKVWVLGAKNYNADEDIGWYQDFPNFSDADVLIVNLASLTREVLDRIKSKYKDAREPIWARYIHGGAIIFITARYFTLKEREDDSPVQDEFSNWYLSPFTIETKDVKQGYVIRPAQDYEFPNYISHVRSYDYYLLPKRYPIAAGINSMNTLPRYSVMNNSGNSLAIGLESHFSEGGVDYTSTAIFLPPPTEMPVEEGIDLLLQKYGKHTEIRSPPQWISQVSITGLKDIDSELGNLKAQKEQIEQRIRFQMERRQKLTNHYRLLYADGNDLEDAVLEAFKILGFQDIIRPFEKEKEDLVFEFTYGSKYKHATLEVKGANRRTSRQNLNQCHIWADEYSKKSGQPVKPVFIPNQHRYEPYPNSKSDRIHFEPNELGYAKSNDICIIPTCLIFEVIDKSLLGESKPRDKLESLIAGTKGVLDEM